GRRRPRRLPPAGAGVCGRGHPRRPRPQLRLFNFSGPPDPLVLKLLIEPGGGGAPPPRRRPGVTARASRHYGPRRSSSGSGSGAGAGPAAVLATGARGPNNSTASTAPSRAMATATAKAAWKPSVIAPGPAPGPARATATVDKMAIPSALPMLTELSARPAASPDSRSAAPVSAAIWEATKALPRPAPNTSRPKNSTGQ